MPRALLTFPTQEARRAPPHRGAPPCGGPRRRAGASPAPTYPRPSNNDHPSAETFKEDTSKSAAFRRLGFARTSGRADYSPSPVGRLVQLLHVHVDGAVAGGRLPLDGPGAP